MSLEGTPEISPADIVRNLAKAEPKEADVAMADGSNEKITFPDQAKMEAGAKLIELVAAGSISNEEAQALVVELGLPESILASAHL